MGKASVTLRGYYAILDIPAGDGASFSQSATISSATLEHAERLLAARPCMLQIRAKSVGAGALARLARALLPLTRTAGVPLCVNDRLDVALAVGAEAVHLGQDDLPLEHAKGLSLGRVLIGISTHNVEQARIAVASGADYIGFGPIFATSTKGNPDAIVGTAMLREVATQVGAQVPIVAIGGIDLGHVGEVAAAGAAAAAVIGAIVSAPDPTAAGRAINHAFTLR